VEMNKTGNKLIVLTQTPRGDFHSQLDKLGVENYSKLFKNRFTIINYIRHFFYLISFCRKHRIRVLWSHLNACNFVAVFAQHFIKGRVVIFRHHFHTSIKTMGFSSVNINERRLDRVINKKAREIVVPSLEVYNGMIKYEKVASKKISIVPYIYDFSQYAKPNVEQVHAIREKYFCRLLIITASRMLKMKRHELVLPVYKNLIEKGYDIKVLLLDEGQEKSRLEDYVKENNLTERIFFLGFKRNIIDYLMAADLLVHPSYTEASSSLVKEVGLEAKPVIVCSGVGDFDQYIINKENGFLVQPHDEAMWFEKDIIYIYDNPDAGKEMGKRLRQKVIDMFTPNEKTMQLYLSKI